MDRFGLAHRISRKQDRLLDRLRDRRTDAAARLPGTADSFEALIGEEFALLVTFRRSGEPVPTPVWFGMHDGRLYVESLADAGKVKRLRRDRRARVAPCTVHLRDAVAASYLSGTRELMLNDSVLVAPRAERRHARPRGNPTTSPATDRHRLASDQLENTLGGSMLVDLCGRYRRQPDR